MLRLATVRNVPIIEHSAAAGTPVTVMQQDGGSLVASLAARVLVNQDLRANVLDYGAVGDGTTDDTAAIQAAITAAASSGVEVFIPAGTYVIASTLTRPGVVTIKGDGRSKTILSYTGSGKAIDIPSPGTRTYLGGIFDLTITTSTGAIGINLDSVSLGIFERLDITGFSDKGIRVYSPTSGYAVYNRFAAVRVQSAAMPNAAIGFALDGTSSNANVFYGCRTNLCNVGVSISDSNDNHFDGCQFESGGTGVIITSSISGLSGWNRLIACRVENNTLGVSIDANTSDTTIVGLWVGGNDANFSDAGIRTHRTTDKMSVNAAGTIVADSIVGATGFAITSSTGTFQGATSTALRLAGNAANSASAIGVFIGNGTTLSNADARIACFCRDTPITNAQRAAYIRGDGGYEFASNGIKVMSGAGTPEGSVTAVVGSLYLRSDGGANTSMYVKESGTGNTGWVAK